MVWFGQRALGRQYQDLVRWNSIAQHLMQAGSAGRRLSRPGYTSEETARGEDRPDKPLLLRSELE